MHLSPCVCVVQSIVWMGELSRAFCDPVSAATFRNPLLRAASSEDGDESPTYKIPFSTYCLTEGLWSEEGCFDHTIMFKR